MEQATAYLQQQAGNGYPEAQGLLEQLGAQEDLIISKTATVQTTSLRTNAYDTLLSLPILGSATTAFARRSERLQVKKLVSNAGSITLPAVVTPQIGIPAPDETVTKEDIRQDLKDRRELKEVLRTAGGTSTLTKVALGALGIHALAQTAKAISAPPPSLTMPPIQPQPDNSYTGVVNIRNCPGGTCPGFLSLSRPASDIGHSAPLCQIDTSRCVGNLCKTSPECGLAATTRPQPDGSTEVTYTVSPKTPGAFQVEYASEDGLATARYDVPATLPAGEEFITENNTPQQTEDSHFDMPDSAISTREKRASENCIDMAISANGVAYVGRGYDWNPIQNTRWREVGSATYSQHPVRVNNKDCHPVYEVQRYYGRQKITRTEYWRENYPRTVSCNGGGNGTAIPSQQSDPSGLHFSYIGPFNISSDHRCIAPDNVAYDCPNDKAFAPPPNTPGGPLYISGIPRGRWNTALRGINPNAVASNADGQHVRWGSYVNRLKSVYPNARCEGQNHGQPNAAFLNLDNLVDVYNVEASENPALNCAAANSFSVQPNTPANPLRINLIPIGETNKALNGANPNALVTKGYGRGIGLN